MSGRRALRRTAALALAMLALAAVGCASTDAAGSRTGGRTLWLNARHPQNARSLYVVEADGSLSFGGGQSAWLERTTWTGPMTDGEIAELLALLERYEWFEQAPGPRKGDALPTYEIRLTGPEGRRKYRVVGVGAGTEEIETLLAGVARRRLDPFLESLPRPDLDELMRQNEAGAADAEAASGGDAAPR